MTSSQLLKFYYTIMQDLGYIVADPCVTANISSLCGCGVHATALRSGRTPEPHWSPLVSYSRKAVHIRTYFVSHVVLIKLVIIDLVLHYTRALFALVICCALRHMRWKLKWNWFFSHQKKAS